MVMEYNYVGRSGLRVSNICLGTMTFGREGVRKNSYSIFSTFQLEKIKGMVNRLCQKVKAFFY